MNQKLYFISLGCPKNLVDSEMMLGSLTEQNYEITDVPEEADIIIINTCSFIHDAKKESIDSILEMSDYKREDKGKCKKLVVTGCLPQRYISELEKELPEVDLFLGTSEYKDIADILKQNVNMVVSKRPSIKYNEKSSRVLTTPNYMAWQKIGDGCNRHCTFCIIPKLRGEYRSRKVESLLLEAKEMVESGIKEINLVAQDLSIYGEDLATKNTLFHLLRGLEKLDDLNWIRLMYFYPDELQVDLLRKIKNSDKICNYLDIPVQHFSDSVLKRMNRKITGEKILEKISMARKIIPDISLRTSIIVGFPGETEDDFNILLDGMKRACFNHLGVFPYSDEEGTAAFKMDNKLSESIIQERLQKVYELQKEITMSHNQSMIGKVLNVMVEGLHEETDLLVVGRYQGQAPEIDGKIIINDLNDKSVHPGDFVQVKISEVHDYDLIGSVLNV